MSLHSAAFEGVAELEWSFCRSLHGTCNYLLAIGGVFDTIHQTAHIPFLYSVVSGRNFIDLPTCVEVLTVPFTGLNVGLLMTLFVGCDRLFSVLLPTR